MSMRHLARVLAWALAAGAAATQAVPGGGPAPRPGPGPAGPPDGAAGLDALVYRPAPAWTEVDYTYPSVVSHRDQRFHLFRPKAPPPPEGWPVLVAFIFSGGVSTDRYIEIDADAARTEKGFVNPSGLYFACLENGIAVVSASCSVCNGGASSNQPPEAFNGGQPGGGVFYPPMTISGIPFAAYEQPDRPMAAKDAVMLVQYLKLNAQALQIDPERVLVDAGSAGATTLTWLVFGPDQAGVLDASPHGLQSSRVAGAILRNGATNLEVYDGSVIGGILWAEEGVGAPLFGSPAELIGQCYPTVRQTASATFYDDPDLGTWALNDELPVFLFYDKPADDPTNVVEPYQPGTETEKHSALHGMIWKTRHPEATRLAVKPGSESGLEDLVIDAGANSPATGAAAFAWLQEVLAGLEGG